ncbi:16S rRNA processing protein RimM [Geobacter metallireducens RCH3]|uniref:Ribosome maturation factor RimM n=1 Tax=Geobacter metallireducens (strain ATCC 53774 / DSM 7210 / GS-15) TaxID=269799 RepID=RIMM_GEOMG|nr:ribosome maturation factor RimM [Geobacter metallireducens]Q39RN7.1 RecName: Full=Ribosome maturation factor RimM [Geobacter metallireducens GS-15]ABB33087.1 16S rRNA processing protein RimM [Geobacter metallireducens GS-15]EHP84164.1 16S rRNA processing protein RimM [Geobacter metallireducens RCH3]
MLGSTDLVLLGKVVATHGIRGQLSVVPFSGEFSTILSMQTVYLSGPDNRKESFEVDRAAVHRNRVLLTLKGFANINEVLHLVGRELFARRDQFPPLDEGEFYWCDLIGLSVTTSEGLSLGRIEEIIATGSNDVYVVRDGEREYLIPALEDIVVGVDLDKGIMTVSPTEGLLDL